MISYTALDEPKRVTYQEFVDTIKIGMVISDGIVIVAILGCVNPVNRGVYVNSVKIDQSTIYRDYYICESDNITILGETNFKGSNFAKYLSNGIMPGSLDTFGYSKDLMDFIGGFLSHSDLHFYHPNVDKEDKSFIYYWPNANAREKGKAGREKTTFGKFLRRCMGMTSDTLIEAYVERFKLQYQEMEYTFKHSKKKEDFVHAYVGPFSQDRMFDTSSNYKKLTDSCMRYEADCFDNNTDGHHPVEAYASGDFTIFWVEDQKGGISARCTAYEKTEGKYCLAPIYAHSKQAIDFLEAQLEGFSHTGVNAGSWEGAELVVIENDDGQIVAPYLDGHSGGNLCGNRITISDDDDNTHEHGADGTWEESEVYTCGDCDSTSSDCYFTNSDGVCSSCQEDRDDAEREYEEEQQRERDEEEAELERQEAEIKANQLELALEREEFHQEEERANVA